MTATTAVSIHDGLETLREAYKACWYKRFTKDGRPISCRSPRCPNPLCRRKYAEKESAILIRSFRDKPPDYWFTLKIEDDEHTADVQMAAYLRGFVQRVRDHRKATGVEFEYDIRLEFDEYGQPHGHMTLITGHDWTVWKAKDVVRGWWQASCGDRPVKVYCDTVDSPTAQARYVTKNLRSRRGVLPPPDDWNGKKCRLNWRSRGFLTKSKETLWKEQVAEWFPASTHPNEPPQGDEEADDTTNAGGAATRPVAAFWRCRWALGAVRHDIGPLRAVLCEFGLVSGRGVVGGDRCREARDETAYEEEYDMMTLKEFMAMQEGVFLPDRPIRKGLSKLNPLPTTNAHRKRLHAKPGKPSQPFAPTVRRVAEIVPNKLIPKLSRRSGGGGGGTNWTCGRSMP